MENFTAFRRRHESEQRRKTPREESTLILITFESRMCAEMTLITLIATVNVHTSSYVRQ